MNFAIVILSYNQPETTIDCMKSIQAVKPREFSDKQIFIVHNGSDDAVVQDLRQRFPRSYHVVLKDNEGFAAGANAGLSAAFSIFPWVLFLTQDTSLVHFPKSTPFEPCMATVKIYKRNIETLGSLGGAVDLELAKAYLCPKAEVFWNSFESEILSPYVPRTAFWMHQSPFEKLGGFDEVLGTMWEDIDFSLRMRREGEMLQLDDGTEVIHHRKGICRKEHLYTKYYYNRNRFIVSRSTPRSKASQVKFEIGLFIEWMFLMLENLGGINRSFVFNAYVDGFKKALPWRYGEGMAIPADVESERQAEAAAIASDDSDELVEKKPEIKPRADRKKTKVSTDKVGEAKTAGTQSSGIPTLTNRTSTRTELDEAATQTASESVSAATGSESSVPLSITEAETVVARKPDPKGED